MDELLIEEVTFKNPEAERAFNQEWVQKFSAICEGRKLTYYRYLDYNYWNADNTYYIDKVIIGDKTGRLLLRVFDDKNKKQLLAIKDIASKIKLMFSTTRPHYSFSDNALTNKVKLLTDEYLKAYHDTAKDSNSVYRIQFNAESGVKEKIVYGKELAAAIKGTDAEQWVKENITNILFKVPTTNLIENPPKSLVTRLDRIVDILEDNFRGITSSRHFERFDKSPEKVKAYYSFWGISAITTFSQPYSAFPEELKELVRDAKARSKEDAAAYGKQVDNTADEPKPNDKTIGTCYFAFAMLDLLDDDYTFLDKAKEDTRTPEEIADDEDTFKQNFDPVNAYGEKVESLKEV